LPCPSLSTSFAVEGDVVAPGMGAELEVKVLYGTYWR